jgi:hypothetical protein
MMTAMERECATTSYYATIPGRLPSSVESPRDTCIHVVLDTSRRHSYPGPREIAILTSLTHILSLATALQEHRLTPS